MKSTPPSSRRQGPTGGQRAIAAVLRRRIANGALAPGARLATRLELQQQFTAAPVTVQKALDLLKADGFVRTAGSRGTFVNDSPPCFTRLALVTSTAREDELAVPCLGQALQTVVRQAPPPAPWTLAHYHRLSGHRDEPDYLRLLDDLQHDRLGGIIFGESPFRLVGTPLWAALVASGLPQVAIMSSHSFPHIPAFGLSDPQYVTTALAWLQAQGRRRLAVIATASSDLPAPLYSVPKVLAAAPAYGLTCQRQWVQVMAGSLVGHARALAHLLLSGPAAERPDALLVLDDRLVASTTQGACDAGRTPADLSVVGHTNFPLIPPAALPTARLGYDIHDLVQRCVATLAATRRGDAVPGWQSLPARLALPTT